MSYLEGNTLPEILKVRRKDLAGTPRAMSGLKMGQHLIEKFGRTRGRSGAWVSNLENGTADFDRLAPEVKLELLHLYHFTDDEIAHLDERFSLRLPLGVKNLTPQAPQTLDRMPAQTITRIGAGGFKDVDVANFAAAGRKLEDVIQVHAENEIYASIEVLKSIPRGSYLYFDKKGTPQGGKTALFKVKDHDRFVILPYSERIPEIYVPTFDGKDGMKLDHDDPPLELLGILYGVTTLEPKD